ncbi:MAG TPA: hypothetical protein VNZ27_11500 [Rhodanobacter sp.]|jgi:ribosomal protein L7/L12|nr:hypothetical protein [Rhodanobacter sp.]
MHWDAASVVFGIFLFIAGYQLGHVRAARESRKRWTPNPNISDANIEAEIRAGRYIEAIKLYRQRDGSGLKEAKQAVDAMRARINFTHKSI